MLSSARLHRDRRVVNDPRRDPHRMRRMTARAHPRRHPRNHQRFGASGGKRSSPCVVGFREVSCLITWRRGRYRGSAASFAGLIRLVRSPPGRGASGRGRPSAQARRVPALNRVGTGALGSTGRISADSPKVGVKPSSRARVAITRFHVPSAVSSVPPQSVRLCRRRTVRNDVSMSAIPAHPSSGRPIFGNVRNFSSRCLLF
jgi:hypothetical protein